MVVRYMLLIYTNEASEPQQGSQEYTQYFQDYGTFTEEVNKAGAFLAGDALMPVSTATTVRVREGKALTTDGPFAETKEQLGGFYMLNCKDVDEALAWAAKIPGAKYGSIEVRPVMEFDQQ
jgi:hypothetical protein